VFAWVGKAASLPEKSKALKYAQVCFSLFFFLFFCGPVATTENWGNTRGWIAHGSRMDRADRAWTRMDRAWIAHGSRMDRAWIAHGSRMDRAWIAHGSRMDPLFSKK
jgi:hypothetical protein